MPESIVNAFSGVLGYSRAHTLSLMRGRRAVLALVLVLGGHVACYLPSASAGTGEMSPCLLYTSPSPRDATLSRMPSSA